MVPCQESQGTFKRSGPDAILVSRESATGGRSEEEPLSTIQIDENHSDMVKFSHGDHRVHIFASKIAEICGSSLRPLPALVDSAHDHIDTNSPDNKDQELAAPEVPQWSADSRYPIFLILRPP